MRHYDYLVGYKATDKRRKRRIPKETPNAGAGVIGR